MIGGHSDRLQGIEYIDGKPVVYSIGSVLTDGTSRYSAVLKLNITSEGLKEMSLVPGIQTEDMTEYLDSTETQKKMYDAVAALARMHRLMKMESLQRKIEFHIDISGNTV